MTTEIYMFLPPLPSGANYYREAHPYGPDSTAIGFNTDLAIEIDPGHINGYGRALAAVNGLVRVISNDPSTKTGTLLLQPDPIDISDIFKSLDSPEDFVFIYRNLDLESIRSIAMSIIKGAADEPFLASEPLDSRVDSFLSGNFPIHVSAGSELGIASANGGTAGWGKLGFEIVYTPAGLRSKDTGRIGTARHHWDRLKELTSSSSMTRRLDPMAFYARISLLPSSAKARLTSSHNTHILLTLPSRRTLIELRDEYDLPFDSLVTIRAGTASPITQSPPAGSRGTFIFASLPSGGSGPPENTEYEVMIENHVLTVLPSGSSAARSQTSTLRTPSHWTLQTIFMNQNPNVADEEKSWFVENTLPLMRYTENNNVTAIQDGVDVFRQYSNIMRTAIEPGNFIFIAGWRMIDNFPLINNDNSTTVQNINNSAALKGAQVRALLWDKPVLHDNQDSVDHINALPEGRGQAILDHDVLDQGFASHHQKFLVVNGKQGAFAFCGGVDINTDRRDSQSHGALGAFHDIHAKIDGPAVADVHRSFVDRWNNNADRGTMPMLSTSAPPFNSNVGSIYVQVACTYPPARQYQFAPQGSLVPLNAFIRGIRKAKKFIYIEEQYLTPYPGRNPATADNDTVGVTTELRAALPRIDYLLIVIPNHSDQFQNRFRRQQFIEALRAIDPNKVHVFFLSRPVPPHPKPGVELAIEGGCDRCSGGRDHRNEIYCHSKVWIVDDICAKIGSCNMNRRSYTHDSEMDIIMVDGALHNGHRLFATQFRLNLWGEHLNMNKADNILLEDHKAALSFWLSPPPGARIVPYDHNAEIEDIFHTGHQIGWDKDIDPDGR